MEPTNEHPTPRPPLIESVADGATEQAPGKPDFLPIPGEEAVAAMVRDHPPVNFILAHLMLLIGFLYRQRCAAEGKIPVGIERWHRDNAKARAGQLVAAVLDNAPWNFWIELARSVLARMLEITVSSMQADGACVDQGDAYVSGLPQERIGRWFAEALSYGSQIAAIAITNLFKLHDWSAAGLECLLGIGDNEEIALAEVVRLAVADGHAPALRDFGIHRLNLRLSVPSAEDSAIVSAVAEALRSKRDYWQNAEHPLSYIARTVVNELKRRAAEDSADARKAADHGMHLIQLAMAPGDIELVPASGGISELQRIQEIDLDKILSATLDEDQIQLVMARSKGFERQEISEVLGWDAERVERVWRSVAKDRPAGRKVRSELRHYVGLDRQVA